MTQKYLNNYETMALQIFREKVKDYFIGNKAKGRISKRVFQENKTPQIYEKRTFLTPQYAHVSYNFG